MDRWCEEGRFAKGEVLPVATVWRLGTRWYADRLDARWRPKSATESESILESLSLTGAFWRLR